MTISPGSLLANRYRLDKPIGQGGTGVVYAAWDEEVGREVAVKVVRPDIAADRVLVERFRREADVVARFSHPNLVTIHEAILTESLTALVMDLLVGEPLAVRIRRTHQGLAEVEVAEIGAAIASALATGHAAGIIHRDVKPDNVFLVDRGDGARVVPKLLDFGIAKPTSTTGYEKLTATNTVLGTWQYMPPEQAHGRELDGRADVYALGATLYYALCRTRPYQAADMEAAMFALTDVPARPLATLRRDVDPELASIVDRAVVKDVDARWSSARALEEVLRKWLDANAPPTLARSSEPRTVPEPPGTLPNTTRRDGPPTDVDPPAGSDAVSTRTSPPHRTLESPRGALDDLREPRDLAIAATPKGQGPTLHSPALPVGAPAPLPGLRPRTEPGDPRTGSTSIAIPVDLTLTSVRESVPSLHPSDTPRDGSSASALRYESRVAIAIAIGIAMFVLGFVGGRVFLFG